MSKLMFCLCKTFGSAIYSRYDLHFFIVECPSFELACPRVICASRSERGRSFLCILLLLLLLLTSSPAMNAEGIIHRHPASIFSPTHPSIHPGNVGPRESETSKRRERKKPPRRQRVLPYYVRSTSKNPSLFILGGGAAVTPKGEGQLGMHATRG